MIKRYLIFFSWQIISVHLKAQTLLTFNGPEPIANISVQASHPNTEVETFHFTNDQGQVHINLKPPFQIITSHLNFEPLSTTIQESGSYTYQLVAKKITLDEVVITGQFHPQSLKQSVYNVRVIDQYRLASQGAQSIAEALAYELNFQFRRDNAVGNSAVQLQGISGQNIKLLLDGVPIVGRSGVNNEIDLAQIDISTVEKIEIVEGPMAVSYGADALAGVVNIITKSPDSSKWSIDLSLQEETVGKEFALFSEGVHNISFNGTYSFNANWSVQSATHLYKFGGWGGIGRDRLWYPKNQFFQSGAINYEKNNFSLRYRMDYLDESLDNLGTPEQTNDGEDPFAFDKEYLTNRQIHQLQVNIQRTKGSVDNVIAYTDYKRITHRFKSYLMAGVPNVSTINGQDTTSFNTIFFRNTLNDVIQWSTGSLQWHSQLGIDGTIEHGSGTTLSAGDKQITNIGFFGSVELEVGSQVKIRPGIRYAYNNTFRTEPSPSINLKYRLNRQSQLRLSYGRGFRTPSLRELYHEFIDANHNIFGNPNLQPEYSNNINGDFSHRFKNLNWKFSITGFYNNIYNKITYFTPETGNTATTYTNIEHFKTLGGTGTISYEKKSLLISTGFSYTGRYHNFSEDAGNFDLPRFLYSPELVVNLRWTIFNTGITMSNFYKYTGPSQQYQANTEDVNTSDLSLRQVDGFHFWDLSFSKNIANDLLINLGAKNLFDITSVNNNANTGGAHSGADNGQSPIAYGRSFFLKINYNFSK